MAAFPTRAPDVFYAHWATIRADPTNITRTIVADDGSWSATSSAGSTAVDREVGYWIGREHWGRGYRDGGAPAPARRGRRIGRSSRTSSPDNIGSQRVVEHCGFVRVGEAVADDGVHEVIFRLD